MIVHTEISFFFFFFCVFLDLRRDHSKFDLNRKKKMQFFGGSEISPSPPVPTASGNNAHMMYVFNRNGVCLLYREWNRPLHTLNAQQDHKLMFGLLFSLKSLTAKMDPTKYMLHFHFHIYQFQYEVSRAKVYWFIAGLVLKFDLEFELDGFGGLCFLKIRD